MWKTQVITIVCGRELSSSTNTLFFFSLLDHSTIIPAILGPKFNHVEVELGIFSSTIYSAFMNGASGVFQG